MQASSERLKKGTRGRVGDLLTAASERRRRRDHTNRWQGGSRPPARLACADCRNIEMTEAAPLQTSEEPSRCPRPVNYEILVIGSGEAGKYLAWTMAGEGHRSAVVERKLIGRSCMNIACLPSKNIIHAAKVRSFTMRAAEFGVELESAVTSVEDVQARKRAMVDGLIQLQLDRFPGQRG